MRSEKFYPTNEQKNFIFKNYKGISNRDLTEMFNKEFGIELGVDKIKSFKQRNKLDSGLTGYFEKGQAPFSKGKKWDDYVSKEGQANSRKTTFKKGNVPHGTRPIGSQYIDQDGYLYIKVKDKGPRFGGNGKWQQYHHLVWIDAYGAIPKDKVVMFLDRNRSNFDIDNLKMISRQELSMINKYEIYKNDKDINLSLINLIRLINKYNELMGELKNE